EWKLGLPLTSRATTSPSRTASCPRCSSDSTIDANPLSNERWLREYNRTPPWLISPMARYPSHFSSKSHPPRSNGVATGVASIGLTLRGIGAFGASLRSNSELGWPGFAPRAISSIVRPLRTDRSSPDHLREPADPFLKNSQDFSSSFFIRIRPY